MERAETQAGESMDVLKRDNTAAWPGLTHQIIAMLDCHLDEAFMTTRNADLPRAWLAQEHLVQSSRIQHCIHFSSLHHRFHGLLAGRERTAARGKQELVERDEHDVRRDEHARAMRPRSFMVSRDAVRRDAGARGEAEGFAGGPQGRRTHLRKTSCATKVRGQKAIGNAPCGAMANTQRRPLV